MKQLTIIDYGSGNLHSISKAFEKESTSKKIKVKISDNFQDIEHASHVVLPGVGAYGDCIENLSKLDGILEALRENILVKKKPFLGVCVGMQLLSDIGEENGNNKGLGWIKGTVKKLQNQNGILKVPHMGWNEVSFKQNHDILQGIENCEDFYFVHSYYFDCENHDNIVACSTYGNEFPAIIASENIVASQFHPEKSQKAGLKFISNFLEF